MAGSMISFDKSGLGVAEKKPVAFRSGSISLFKRGQTPVAFRLTGAPGFFSHLVGPIPPCSLVVDH